MFKKLLTISLLLMLLSVTLSAQETAILRPNGELEVLNKGNDYKEAIRATKIKAGNGMLAESHFHVPFVNSAAVTDTLSYRGFGTYNTNFGFFGQDVMMQIFVAPADIRIVGAGFTTSDDDGVVNGNASISMRLVKFNWDEATFRGVAAPQHMGWYPSDGDGFGGRDFFGEEATGEWVDSSGGLYPDMPWDHADYDIWSDETFGWPIVPVASSSGAPVYQWVDMAPLGIPELSKGETFAVVARHEGLIMDEERIGFWSGQDATGGPSGGIAGWKFYELERSAGVPSSGGWWARAYAWDFAVAVELTSNRPPQIQSLTNLLTTVSQDARTVEAHITDDNPGGGEAGVAAATLMWSTDSMATWQSAAMSLTAGDATDGTWTGQIAGQPAGSVVFWKVEAEDVADDLMASRDGSTYSIFQPVNTKGALFVYNGPSSAGRTLQLHPYYVQGLSANGDDIWYYGQVTADLLNNYNTVIEIHPTEGSPADENQPAVTEWLAAGNRNFMAVGQEFLGYRNGYTDSVFVAGDFEYDVLGVAESFNDVNWGGNTENVEGSPVAAIAGSVLGGPLADTIAVYAPDTLFYDPVGILGDALAQNWMDQFTPRDDIGSEVFMHGWSNDGTERPVGHNYTDASNNRIYFASYDDLVLLGSDDLWYGNGDFTPMREAFKWFGMNVVGVEDELQTVRSFELAQNYPNPFNPTTKITYSLPVKGQVTLDVYNVLGSKVATLVNEVQNVGQHTVDFNASNLASGVYMYTITAGEFTSTKKMMLLK